MTWLARYRADRGALRALDGGRSPLASAAIDAALLAVVLIDLLALVGLVVRP